MKSNDQRAKLVRLGPEKLADALLELAARNGEADDLVERLVAKPKENIKRFKAKLSGLKRGRRFIDWREASGFARELDGLLADLREGIEDPATGVELVSAFFECDRAVFDRCDDSSGAIGDVFRFTARELFAHFAARCEDKEWLADKLTGLYAADDYGVRAELLDAAGEFLPEMPLRDLADRFWERSKEEAKNSHDRRHWINGVESLARHLKDAPLFEKARRASWPELGTAACLDIGAVYLEAGDAKTALDWILRIPEKETFKADERNRLLLNVYEKLGDRDKMKEMAWRIFRRRRSEDTLATLLTAIGEDQRERVIVEEARRILDSGELSYANTAFLIHVGRIDDAEEYLLKRAEALNGDFYSSLLPLAESLEKYERPLSASVIYRALLESILRRAQSRYYHHGVRYLKKLDKLASRIDDWRDIPPHEFYKKKLLEIHGRKSSFWSRYEA